MTTQLFNSFNIAASSMNEALFSFSDFNKKIESKVDHFLDKKEHFLSHKLGDNTDEPQNQPNTYFRSADYLKKKASDKMVDLWTEISSDKSTGKFPSAVELAGIFVESMNPTFETKGDALGEGIIYGTRTKYIHSVGVVGKVRFASAGGHPYTGIFKGADQGLIRLSSAAAPALDGSQPLAPGFGLKFLRDGQDSANLVAMYGVNGTPGDWNFFSKDFTTFISGPEGAALTALGAKFAAATDYIQEVGLSEMASMGQDGVKEATEVFPYNLRFEPASDVHSLFPSSAPSDPMAYVSQLQTVPENSTLYNVYALDKPTELGGTETLIGALVLDGTFTSSKWGDQNLFFRHQFENDDIKSHPDWAPYTAKWSDKDVLSGCPFGF